MQLINAPGKLVLPFANSGAKNSIPVASQIGITAGAASLTDGFPPLTRTPLAAGGVPPSGLDMNGILYELSAILRWANAGGGYTYDAEFATDSNVGGYPKGARIMRSDGLGYWFNTVENNTTDPEAAGAAAAGWVPDFTNGVTSVAMASTNVTLTPLQYGKPTIVITGTLTANLNLIFPAIAGEWTVINNTTGPFTITCKTASGTGVAVSGVAIIVGDATNIYATSSGITAAQLQAQTYTAFTTGGTTGAFTLTPSPAITAYTAGQRFRVKFSAAGNGSDTINISGLGAKNLKQYDATGAKVSAVVASAQLADVEYDGTDFVILDPLPPNVGAPSSVRQTVLGGPVDSSGYPSFLPATSVSLSVTSQNVSPSAPLTVSSANGFAAGGVFDRVGSSSTDLTWAGLTANATNYLYVDVAANGTLTPGSTTLAPVYQQGGARSTTNGQATFNVGEMYMTVGSGSSAAQAYRVFVGEAVTNASTVTSTVAYAYNGRYDSGFYALAVATGYSKNHNIGVAPLKASQIVAQNSDGSGWLVFTGVQGNSSGVNQGTNIIAVARNTVSLRTGPNYIAYFTDSSGANFGATTGYGRQIIERGW